VIWALLGSMPLIKLTLILLITAGVRGVMTWVRKTSHKSFAGPTSFGGGPDHILVLLGSLLTAGVHLEIKRYRRNQSQGMEWIEHRMRKLADFGNKTGSHRTSLVMIRLVRSGMHRTSLILDSFETKITQHLRSTLSNDRKGSKHNLELLEHD
jgi:hypothetical protein